MEIGFSRKSSAETRGAHGHFDVGLARHHDDGSEYTLGFEFFEKRQSVFAGHHDVGEDEVKGLRFGQFQSLVGVVADGGFVTF